MKIIFLNCEITPKLSGKNKRPIQTFTLNMALISLKDVI